MDARYWDWSTYLLYIILSYLIYFLLSYTIRNSSVVSKYPDKTKKRFNVKVGLSYFSMLFVLVLFSAFREVSGLIGGVDAPVYIDYFLDSRIVNVSIENIIKMNQEEPFFYLVGSFIRFFTGEYLVYFIIIYSFICISFTHFIIKHSNKYCILSPFIYIIVPILGSFNVIRSWFAVAIILFAFSALIEENFKNFLFLCFLAFLTHFSSIIVLITFVIANQLSRLQKKNKLNKNLLVFFVLSLFILFILGKDILRSLLTNTKYRSYGEYTNSIIGQFTTIALGILVLQNYEILIKQMGSKYRYFIYFVLVNFAFTPFVVIFGFWRMIDFFIFPRLIVWSHVIKIYEVKYFNHSDSFKIFYRVLIFMIFSAWTFFRVYKMWYSSGVMPYRTILF